MKLCVIGGGGFRTPAIYEAILRDVGYPRVTEVSLHDTDEHRLKVVSAILARMGRDHEDAPRVRASQSLDEAVAGSDFVFAALRVGGLDGRRRDEHVALDLGVLGQETTGPGGLAYALRTVPTMVRVCTVIRELAPGAFVMNFTNPAGIVTEAMQAVLGDRVLGICDTPSGLGRRIGLLLGLDPTRLEMDYVGLNHLGWMRRIVFEGKDVLPGLLANHEVISRLEEGRMFGPRWLETLGSIPNEYLYYYYNNRDAVRDITAAGLTRGDLVAASQREFYGHALEAGDDIVHVWRQAVAGRTATYMAEAFDGSTDDTGTGDSPGHSDEGYAGVALAVMNAISRNARATMILNVRNGSTVSGLPADAVVEVPATVDANGAHPLSIEQPQLDQIGLMQQVKAVERLVIESALTGSRRLALKAFALHPLVDSVGVAEDLLQGYLGHLGPSSGLGPDR